MLLYAEPRTCYHASLLKAAVPRAPTSTKLRKVLNTVGSALPPTRTSASIERCSKRTSTADILMPTLHGNAQICTI